MRAWYLEDNARYSLERHAHNKRLEAATGVTGDEYHDLDYHDPRRKELEPVA
jgi:hypothetical protein